MNAFTMTTPVTNARAILDQKIAQGTARAANVIATIHRDIPSDMISRSSALAFRVSDAANGLGAVHIHAGPEEFSPSEYALGQIGTRAGMPIAYLRELVNGEARWQRVLASHALNEHFGNSTGRVLLRSVRGQLRGMLSDKFRRLDNRPLVDALALEAQKVGAIPVDGVATETRVAIKLLMPEIVEPVPGEYMVYGGEWSNSDYGNGANGFRAFALRVVCLNGMTSENLMRQIHLGAKLDDNIEFSARTLRLDTQTSVSALRDIIRGSLGERGRERMTASIRLAAGKAMSKGQVQAATRGFSKETGKAVVDAFDGPDTINLPPGDTAWRASNAFSWIARNTKDDELRLDLERAAGALV